MRTRVDVKLSPLTLCKRLATVMRPTRLLGCLVARLAAAGALSGESPPQDRDMPWQRLIGVRLGVWDATRLIDRTSMGKTELHVYRPAKP
jgi:hypothetical protein